MDMYHQKLTKIRKYLEKRRGPCIGLFLFFSFVFVTVPSIGLVSADNMDVLLEKVDRQIVVFETTIQNSNNVGIDTKRLESIVSKVRKERDSLGNSISEGDSRKIESHKDDIFLLSDDFSAELHNIRKSQDKKDVERAIGISEKQINRTDKALEKLESKGIKKKDSNDKLEKIKSHYNQGKRLYQSGDYKNAEEELRRARKEHSTLMGDLEPDLKTIGSES